jgi:hypothetical protein
MLKKRRVEGKLDIIYTGGHSYISLVHQYMRPVGKKNEQE